MYDYFRPLLIETASGDQTFVNGSKISFFHVVTFYFITAFHPSIMQNDLHLIRELCREHAIPATDKALELLVRYTCLLEEWNGKINLISRKEDAPVILKHVFHSLLICRIHEFKPGEKVLDLGTGGGLPGIPLAILFPETSFLLVDSTGKKIAACKAMIKELGLVNVMAIHSRVEELKGVAFDTVLSRQVAPLEELCGYCSKLLKQAGVLICLKGGVLDTEIADAVASREKHLGFPSSVDQLPIGDISPLFSEKQIVIARW
jgi:16S rRNA (guanine527-N7)-methyltransferase